VALKEPRHVSCFKVTMHFHDRADARAVVDAASLDDQSMWKIAMEACRE